MTPVVFGLVVFICTFGAALAGMKLRAVLPEHHINKESNDTVRLGVGLIATMTALILGLVTASAKDSFDDVNRVIKESAANVLVFDRILARYGPETSEMRAALKRALADRIAMTWPRDGSRRTQRELLEAAQGAELISTQVRSLTPKTEEQRLLQSRALDFGESLLNVRWHIYAGLGSSIPVPFFAMLLFWLSIAFASFGLFAPKNATVVSVFFVCALSVAGAIFLVLEMDGPFDGLIKASARPLENALAYLKP